MNNSSTPSHFAEKKSAPESLKLLSTLADFSDSLPILELTKRCKVLRNCCNGDEKVVDLIIQYKAVLSVVSVCQNLSLSKFIDTNMNENNDFDQNQKENLVLSICQFLANFSASSELSKKYLFSIDLNFLSLSHVLSAAVTFSSRKAVSACFAMTYNCIQSDNIEGIRRCWHLCSSHNFLCQLLLSTVNTKNMCLQTADKTMINNAAKLSSLYDVSDPAMEWFHMLGFLWMKRNLFYMMYTKTLAPTLSVATSASHPFRVTHEQLILLQLAAEVFEDPYCNQLLTASANNNNSSNNVRSNTNTITDCITETNKIENELSVDEVNICCNPGSNIFKNDQCNSGGVLDFICTIANDLCSLSLQLNIDDMLLSFSSNLSDNNNDDNNVRNKDGTTNIDAMINNLDEKQRISLLNDFIPLSLQLIASVLAVTPILSPLSSISNPVETLGGCNKLQRCGSNNLRELLLLCNSNHVSNNNNNNSSINSGSTENSSNSIDIGNRNSAKLTTITTVNTTTTTNSSCSNSNSNTTVQEQQQQEDCGVNEDFISVLVNHILRGRDIGTRKKKQNSPTTTSTDSDNDDRLKYCVRTALQLLGNLTYKCDQAKDALRTSGGLAVVLSHCATDFDNPIAREWALLCVRNACDGHIENQNYIEQLRPQGVVVQDEALKAQGLKVEMNTETGKFKLSTNI